MAQQGRRILPICPKSLPEARKWHHNCHDGPKGAKETPPTMPSRSLEMIQRDPERIKAPKVTPRRPHDAL
eukprot:1857301-Pyramimonas_sp.AAC.1